MSTIDPGMEDPLKEASDDVEGEVFEDDKDADTDDEDDFTYPSTWWFASTACPLLAGTFGPVASGFNICALVYNWRVYVPPGVSESVGTKLPDPKWLIAINAISLVFAIIGNATLLLNMGRRLKFSTAQPITITGFLLGGVMLIADIAAINASPTYFITDPQAIPDHAHALTSAYYYAIWAAAIYIIIGLLMCVTVFGANKGFYDKDFKLTPPQRTLMLQTMSFMAYILLGALVFSSIEGWEYLNAVYWADVTILTVGLGDYYPTKSLSRGLLFPFAIGGVLIVGLVIGSIRSLVLERGKEKMSARITEKRRQSAINNVNVRQQTIKVSWFARADFSTDPNLSPAQRREEEFKVMRKVQKAAERERRYFALFVSASFALMLWFVGAAIFMVCESDQGWTYFDSLYFSFVVLMTIGYGDLTPSSNSGRAFFVVWSLLAVPSLTILISNMGDTIVKGFSDLTIWIGSITVLPHEEGFRASLKKVGQQSTRTLNRTAPRFTPPGLFGAVSEKSSQKKGASMDRAEHQKRILDHMSRRLEYHIEQKELSQAQAADAAGDQLQRDIHFYLYVLARELRNVQKDMNASPPRQYTWPDWEYYLKLIGIDQNADNVPGERNAKPLVPEALQSSHPIGDTGRDEPSPTTEHTSQHPGSNHGHTNGVETAPAEQRPQSDESTHETPQDKPSSTKDSLQSWSWLSQESPLMCSETESEWIMERLSAALERELDRQRKGDQRPPPISTKDAVRIRHGRRDSQDRPRARTEGKASPPASRIKRKPK